ncbi:MAG: 1-deoxy-D-xylulose-5-phosphate synthase [Nanoarchaeota archaeon]|nr:1-deoxy-D-xylulose-5-phosphate synthase [Nanoarchaeota archaeon]MBU1704081.1 1-deoxy-D-xylulose-5-phosphate synthase [Nanoarchaeota archaeon]
MFLDMINEPKDLRVLTKEQLKSLAQELRDKIISTVAKTGGHLASNLGVVELTIAMHYVFDSPTDKIVWDVGHQSYTHKLLTGRKEQFDTLRQYKGLAGFPKREESLHDAFNTGHSSTSISAALGIAKARDLKKEDYSVIAVIGDGALTGGMSFEGLNQAGHMKSNLIVVLNDNERSIGPNVGALSSYLQKMVTDPHYHDNRKKALGLIKMLPKFGAKAAKAIFDLEETMRAFTTTPGLLFKELGFKYYGPVNGHNLGEMIRSFENIKQIKGPVLLHVMTKKGHGYKPAEDNKTRFHGIGSFNVENGEVEDKGVTFTNALSDSLIKLAKKDEKIVAITAAMASGTGLDKFAEIFPDRFFDVGIAEQHAVTFAAGLASNGMRPVVAIYSTFLQRAYDQIVHDVCMQNLPVVFAIDRAGLVGDDGPTHHGAYDLSFLRNIPNLTIMAPKDEKELGSMLKAALEAKGPVAIRYPRGSCCGALAGELKSTEIGKAMVCAGGSNLVIFAVGSMVSIALASVPEMKKQGIYPCVVDIKTIKPLDEEMIVSQAKRLKKVITIEENALPGGFGSAVLELLEKHKVKADVRRIGIPDEFIEQGKVNILKERCGLCKENLIKVAKELLK